MQPKIWFILWLHQYYNSPQSNDQAKQGVLLHLKSMIFLFFRWFCTPWNANAFDEVRKNQKSTSAARDYASKKDTRTRSRTTQTHTTTVTTIISINMQIVLLAITLFLTVFLFFVHPILLIPWLGNYVYMSTFFSQIFQTQYMKTERREKSGSSVWLLLTVAYAYTKYFQTCPSPTGRYVRTVFLRRHFFFVVVVVVMLLWQTTAFFCRLLHDVCIYWLRFVAGCDSLIIVVDWNSIEEWLIFEIAILLRHGSELRVPKVREGYRVASHVREFHSFPLSFRWVANCETEKWLDLGDECQLSEY